MMDDEFDPEIDEYGIYRDDDDDNSFNSLDSNERGLKNSLKV
jgi:hypothetical protein